MKSILILLASFNLMSAENGIYRIFYAVSDGVFFFLPFLLAITSSRQLKTNTFISLMVPIAFLYPAISETLENGGTFNLLCFKVPPAVYHSSVIPVLLAVGLLHFIEKLCDRLQEAVRGFLKPIICMAVVLPATFMIFGPAGTYIGAVLTKAFFSIYSFNPVAAGAFMGNNHSADGFHRCPLGNCSFCPQQYFRKRLRHNYASACRCCLRSGRSCPCCGNQGNRTGKKDHRFPEQFYSLSWSD